MNFISFLQEQKRFKQLSIKTAPFNLTALTTKEICHNSIKVCLKHCYLLKGCPSPEANLGSFLFLFFFSLNCIRPLGYCALFLELSNWLWLPIGFNYEIEVTSSITRKEPASFQVSRTDFNIKFSRSFGMIPLLSDSTAQ